MTTQMQTQPLPTPAEQEQIVADALARAEEYRKRKEFKEGIHLLVEALRYGINKAMIYYRLGNIYIDAGDLSRAEYAYKRALEIDPHHVNAMHNLAVVYKRQGKISLYVKTYKKSQRMEIRHPRAVPLTPEAKRRLHRFGWQGFLLALGGVGLLFLVLYAVLH